MKHPRNLLGILMITLLAACGLNDPTETIDLSQFSEEIHYATNDLINDLDELPVSDEVESDNLAQSLTVAFPRASQLVLIRPRKKAVRSAITRSGSGVGPNGGYWRRAGGTFANSEGQNIHFGGGYAFNPMALGATGGIYNEETGNRVYGGVVYVPGYGLGAAVRGCSVSTSQCGTVVIGLGKNQGGVIKCYNRSCTGKPLY